MSQDELKPLLTKRRQVKAAVTRFRKFLDSVNTENPDIIGIEERLKSFESCLAVFEEIQSSIEFLNEAELDSDAREEFENSYYTLISTAKRLILKNKNNDNPMSTNSGSIGGSINNHIRLPKIELPTFDGNYEHWYSFYETFESLINSNEDITAVQKLHYLRSCLRGNAKDLVLSLDITPQNFTVAWDLLKNRYDNKTLIIKKHIRELFEMPHITKECSSGLRKIIDTTEKHIRALHALNRPTEHWDDVMIYLVCCKIDEVTSREWESSVEKNSIPKLSELITFISHKCQTLEVCQKNPH